MLYNSEPIFQEALDRINDGATVNGVNVNKFRYTDDTVLLASNREELQKHIDRITGVCNE